MQAPRKTRVNSKRDAYFSMGELCGDWKAEQRGAVTEGGTYASRPEFVRVFRGASAKPPEMISDSESA